MSDSVLMKQRVNVTNEILIEWSDNLNKQVSSIISKFLIKPIHINKLIKFDVGGNERSFKIIGMSENEHIILEEILNTGIVYWECTYQLVQYKLGLFNRELIGSYEIIPYTDSQLYINIKSRKKRTPKEAVESFEDLTKEFDENSLFDDEE